jgi:acylphosphatase
MHENKAVQKVGQRCWVAGQVQGVFFRAFTRERAQQLGLTGYARNTVDGRVEVLACGEPEAVAQLREWLREGPPGARVSGVMCEVTDYQELSGFSIL